MSLIPAWQHSISFARTRRENSRLALVDIVGPIPHPPTERPSNVIPLIRDLLSTYDLQITETSPEALLAQLAAGTLSAEAVTRAFLRRAAGAQSLVNCITELLPESALKRAKELDEFRQREGRVMGELHGLPISVKEQIGIKGLECNRGFCVGVGTQELVREEDALLVEVLQGKGAVLYVRTTEPQCLMHLETSTNLFGTTVNPYNTKLTAGGSSGGEGALLALQGSALGVGTDVGGSIRSPAANCGVYGLKPTTSRLPMTGIEVIYGGTEPVLTTCGPMSTTLEGIKIFMKSVLSAKPWLREPGLVPLEWREAEDWSTRKLRLGVMLDDGVVKPHPPITRAINEFVASLPQDRVEIITWNPDGAIRHDESWSIISSLYFPDGGDEERSLLAASGESWLPLTQWIINENANVKTLSIHELWALCDRREQYRVAYAKAWEESGMDVLLCPTGPGAAPPLECAKYWTYTSVWNLLDYPALVFPVSKVKPSDEFEPHQPRNLDDQFNIQLYTEPDLYRDAPVGLQLVGRRFEDEKVVYALEMLLQTRSETSRSY